MKRIVVMVISGILAVSMVGTDVFAVQNMALTKTETKAAKDKKAGKTAKATKAAKAKKAAKLPKQTKPAKIKAYSGYNSVLLKWTKAPKAEGYIILRSVAGKKKFKAIAKTKDIKYKDKFKKEKMYTDYAYRVVAYRHHKVKKSKKKPVLIKSAPAKIRCNSVRKLRIYVTLKKKKKYNGKTIKAGARVMTDGYGGGYYLFDHKGSRHAVSRVAVSNPYAKYQKKGNYRKSEAAMFISDYMKSRRISPKKKYVIWVSTYTQHLYVFKKKRGKWKVAKDWEISTGIASTPSPTGVKKIRKKTFSHHGINWWSCFSSWNALHGVAGGMSASLGRLASHGCVRNPNDNAAWIYTRCPKGTTVIIY